MPARTRSRRAFPLRRLTAALAAAGLPFLLGACGEVRLTPLQVSPSQPAPGEPVTFTTTLDPSGTCRPDYEGRLAVQMTWVDESRVLAVMPEQLSRTYTFTYTFPSPAPGIQVTHRISARATPVHTNCTGAEAWREFTFVGPHASGDPTPPPTPPAMGGPTPPTTTTPTTTTPTPSGPVAAFSVSPEQPDVDVRATFDAASSSDPDGTIVRYDWSFGPHAFPQTATGQSVNASFDSAGTYDVQLTVTDDQNRTATTTRQVVVDDPFAGAVAASHRRRAGARPGAFVTPDTVAPRAGTLLTLRADLQRRAGVPRTYAWDLDGDGRFGRPSRSATVATVLAHGGRHVVGVRVRTAAGRTLTSTLLLHLARADAAASRSVHAPMAALVSSKGAATRAARRVLNRLQKTSRHARSRALADRGTFALSILGRKSLAKPLPALLAPLANATTRGHASIDFAQRRVIGTYLLRSKAPRASTCVRIESDIAGAAATGTLTVLGGTGPSRRLHLTARFAPHVASSRTAALLLGTVRAMRGKARSLPAACRRLTR